MEAEAEAERLAWRKEAADAAMRRRARRIAGESGMGERFLQRTFRTFEAETAEQRKFKAVAQAYARTFDDRLPKRGEPLPGRNGLVISGTKGTGKTHMAAAIANEIMSRGTAVICMTERNLLGRIKQAYSPAGRADENAVRAMYERVPLLAIDDLGKEKATEWTLSTLYAIIDARYERAMPLIVTTNYGARGLAERLTPKGEDKTTADAILDRLSEMCESIVTGGESWRARQ
jgi:DNA replication protein DnaC